MFARPAPIFLNNGAEMPTACGHLERTGAEESGRGATKFLLIL